MEKTDITFKDLGIKPDLLDILDSKSIVNPTPIQTQAIVPASEGDDCIGIAQTGTGKTLAFVLPMIQHLVKNRNSQALIVAPTRELALQLKETCDWFKRSQRMYSAIIIGGTSIRPQLEALRRGPQIIIATPGRLIDHLQRKTVNLQNTDYLVLDEADRMFDMGFAPQIKEILKSLPPKEKRQTLLFSATMPDAIVKLISQHMREPVRIEIATQGSVADEVEQEIIILDNKHRKDALLELLKQTPDAVLVFVRTKFQAKKITQWLRGEGHRAEELHGNRSLAQRKKAVAAVQSKKSRILVATDVAARGIDIPHLRLVVNFDLPEQTEDYVHRIGRTGRAGIKGRAVSFVLSNQKYELSQIQKLINTEIKQTNLESVPAAQLSHSSGPKKSGYRSRSRSSRGRGGSSRGGRGGSSGYSGYGSRGKSGGQQRSSRSRKAY